MQADIEADEQTSLLRTGSKSKDDEETLPLPKNDVHYKNIEGTRFWYLLTTIIISYFLVYFDSFFMATSHPIITSYFNASNAAPWLSTVFFLSTTIFGPFYGRISDVTGRRTMFLFALIMFALTTMWCGAANSIGSFIAARFFCGIGAGGVGGMGTIILADTVKLQYRGIYQSYINLGFGLGSAAGAAFGGIICEALGWRAAFYVQVPLILVMVTVAFWTTPQHLGPSLAKAEGKSVMAALASFDFAGAISLILCLSGLIMGINLGGSILPWKHPVVIASLVMFVVAIAALISAERRAKRPLLPLGLLSTIPHANLNWGNLLGAALSASASFNIPLFLQAVKLVSPTKSGLMLMPCMAGALISSVFTGFAIAKTRKLRPFIVIGILCQFLGTLSCGFLNEDLPLLSLLLFIPWTTIGQGFWFPTTTVATLAISPSDEQAAVVTTLNLSRTLGSIIGVAFSSWILQNSLLLFLPKYVTGNEENKKKIMLQVRKSIQAIGQLNQKHRQEVVQAYAASLRTTFLGCAVLGLILCVLVFPVRLPSLDEDNADQAGIDGIRPRSTDEDA